ncbi:ABC transporter ATP-binding protein [Candidatus Woesearchaeota archaeon]|nr:ABC transporter ATP-binding protein [Candidatus Woesearchaeota archaeon]
MDAIIVRNITKKFGDYTAVDKLSFSIPKNKIFGLLGSNGAGKTTTINMITGLLLPTKGSIKVLNMNTAKEIEKIRQNIALVPQAMSLYEELTVYENIEFFGGMFIEDEEKLKKSINKMLKIFQIKDKADQIVATLSGGYKKRCSIACALVSKPKVLFLDEPLTGIDMRTNSIIMKFIRSIKDMTVIFTTHSIKEAESVCDYIVFMDKGKKILEGTPKGIVKQYSKNLGEDIHIEFKTSIDAVKVEKRLKKSGFKIHNLKHRGTTLSFTSKDIGTTIVQVMDSLNYLKNHVKNIDIVKPDLRTILKHVMDNEDSKSNKKRV